MTKDKIREDLKAIADYQQRFPGVRAEAVQAARDAGMTWREIAGILNMTEHGLIKAQKKYDDNGAKEKGNE